MFSLLSTRIPGSFPAVVLPSWLPPRVHEVIPLHRQDFAFSLVDLHQIALGPIFQPGNTSLSHPSKFCITCEHAECVSIPSSRSLMKILTYIGPSVDPWGTSLVTEFQLDIVLLIRTLWGHPFHQFSATLTVHLSTPYFISLSMRMSRETMLKALRKSR